MWTTLSTLRSSYWQLQVDQTKIRVAVFGSSCTVVLVLLHMRVYLGFELPSGMGSINPRSKKGRTRREESLFASLFNFLIQRNSASFARNFLSGSRDSGSRDRFHSLQYIIHTSWPFVRRTYVNTGLSKVQILYILLTLKAAVKVTTFESPRVRLSRSFIEYAS